MRPNSKVILPYEPGYTGHWEMKKRRKETKESLRQREQEVRDRLNSPSIVPGHGMSRVLKQHSPKWSFEDARRPELIDLILERRLRAALRGASLKGHDLSVD